MRTQSHFAADHLTDRSKHIFEFFCFNLDLLSRLCYTQAYIHTHNIYDYGATDFKVNDTGCLFYGYHSGNSHVRLSSTTTRRGVLLFVLISVYTEFHVVIRSMNLCFFAMLTCRISNTNKFRLTFTIVLKYDRRLFARFYYDPRVVDPRATAV